MRTTGSAGPTDPTTLQYSPVSHQHRFSLSDAFLLALYHLKLLNSWILVVIGLGFAGCAAILWLQLRGGDAESLNNAAQLSRFIIESGAGLVAGLLASSLIMGDPALELMMVTRAGIGSVVSGRFFLSFGLLLFYSAIYLVWSLLNGVSYSNEQGPLFFLLMWLVPVLIVSMLALFCSLITCNASLGMVLGSVPLMGALFLQVYLLPVQQLHPFFIPYTLTGYNAPDWWPNRLTLLGIGLVLAGLNWWLVRHEERLLIG